MEGDSDEVPGECSGMEEEEVPAEESRSTCELASEQSTPLMMPPAG